MSSEAHQKVTASHLRRNAYLYVRQSTMRQVFENTESTQRQYGLRQRAVTLGWPLDRVIVIDSDLGVSGASATDREGFQKLVAEVGLGRAGIVLGLEVSRLARNSTDWHRLLEICALSETLILDEDGIYDPAHFNDRLLLGLKGTMSEAELHVLGARLRGGILSKARRGELRCPLPVGLVHLAGAGVVLDPDQQVQESVRLLFQTFARTGAASATVRYFRQQGLLFPTRVARGTHQGALSWVPLSLGRAAEALHNPWYAGAYVYGRGRWRKQPDGRTRHQRLPKSEWHALIKDAHPGYISWRSTSASSNVCKKVRRPSVGSERRARHGKARPYCKVARSAGYAATGCTSTMATAVAASSTPTTCASAAARASATRCARARRHADRCRHRPTAGRGGDADGAGSGARRAAGDHGAPEETDRLRHRAVERAQYEADQARHRYMQVDAANRLVADSLEADWNVKLRALASAHEAYQRQRTADRLAIDENARQRSMPRHGLPRHRRDRTHRSANASACSGYSSRMSRSSSSARSAPPCAFAAAPPRRSRSLAP